MALREPTERMCIVTRDVGPVDGLIRFVLDPQGVVVADLKRHLPGRGVWVTALHDKVAEAARRGLFSKAFAEPAKAGPELADAVGGRLTEFALGQLSLARKAGALLTGFSKVDGAIRSGSALAVIHASDAKPDGIRKLNGAVHSAGRPLPSIDCFDSSQLGLALGGANVIHAALLAGRAGEGVLKRIDALLRYRGKPVSVTGNAGPTQTGAAEPDKALGQKNTND